MLRLKKSLGQNFLSDNNIIKKIASLDNLKNQTILEIGPGSGNLTEFIIKKQPKKTTDPFVGAFYGGFLLWGSPAGRALRAARRYALGAPRAPGVRSPPDVRTGPALRPPPQRWGRPPLPRGRPGVSGPAPGEDKTRLD